MGWYAIADLTMPATFLSSRAQQLVDRPPFAEYLQAHFARGDDTFDLNERPDGYVALCIAENRLMWSEMAARLSAIPEAPDRVLGYDAMIGALPFREQLAAFMGRRIFRRSVEAEHLAAVAGAGAALELLFYALADPGDAVLVPTPSYAGFWPDLETRDDITIVAVDTDSSEDFRLTPERLDRAMQSASRPVRALLFTTPDNPLGRVHTPSEIEAVLSWADAAGIHVVFDEIYALSVFGDTAFTSVASLRPSLGDRLHIVWAFSKDFGASGLRCGVLYSENEQVLRAVGTLAYWAACSGHTQYALGQVISDTAWVDEYLALQRQRLKARYRKVTDRLSFQGIPFLSAEGGIFVLCDLRGFMKEPTFEGEAALWRRLLDVANVNLTPGSACRIAEPGFFRLCWASTSWPETVSAIDRAAAALRGRTIG